MESKQKISQNRVEGTSPRIFNSAKGRKILFHARWSSIPYSERDSKLFEGDVWKRLYSQRSVASKFALLQPTWFLLLRCSQAEGLRRSSRKIGWSWWTKKRIRQVWKSSIDVEALRKAILLSLNLSWKLSFMSLVGLSKKHFGWLLLVFI